MDTAAINVSSGLSLASFTSIGIKRGGRGGSMTLLEYLKLLKFGDKIKIENAYIQTLFLHLSHALGLMLN